MTAVAADPVTAPWHYNEKHKTTYKVATVAVETAFAGGGEGEGDQGRVRAAGRPSPNEKPPRRVPDRPQLKEGQEVLLFLTRHPTAEFYVLPAIHPPVEVKGEHGKTELESAKRFAAALADPMKGLKSDKAAVRAETAAFLVIKYRAVGESVREVDPVAIPAEESKLILAALLEADWNARPRPFGWTDDPAPHPLSAFQQLYLTEKDGWSRAGDRRDPGRAATGLRPRHEGRVHEVARRTGQGLRHQEARTQKISASVGAREEAEEVKSRKTGVELGSGFRSSHTRTHTHTLPGGSRDSLPPRGGSGRPGSRGAGRGEAGHPLFTPLEKLVRADLVVSGKVTAIEKDTVDALPVPGVKDKSDVQGRGHQDRERAGRRRERHARQGRVRPAAAATSRRAGPVRGGFGPVYLTEGHGGAVLPDQAPQRRVLHHQPDHGPALTAKAEGYKEQVALAKRAAAVLADPMKALKADKAADRSFAATCAIGKYRSYPENAAAKSRTRRCPRRRASSILKALAEGNWKPDPNDPNAPNALPGVQPAWPQRQGRLEVPDGEAGRGLHRQDEGGVRRVARRPRQGLPDQRWVPKK